MGSDPIDLWRTQLGVPAIIIPPGSVLVGAVLADGQLQEIPLDPELGAKVQAVMTKRTGDNGAG